MNKGLLFIISAPAGAGKTTLVNRLKAEMPQIVESVSCTTRSPRPGEINGQDYYFISHGAFENKIKKGEFLEYAKVFDNYYGTDKNEIAAKLALGRHVIL